jgi:hypothetical protein
MIKKLLLMFFVLGLNNLFAQKQYEIKGLNESFLLDGKLDDKVWQGLEGLNNFTEYFPNDTTKAQYDTEIKMFYDNKNLYLSAKMLSNGKKYVIPSFRRDFRAGGNDNVSFCFDTFNDHTNAYLFGTNPYGVMREGLMFNGATDNSYLNVFWDNKWRASASINDDSWTCEMIIPFSTLRFKEGSQFWNFKSYRFDTQSNETTSLVRMPQNQIIMSLGYTVQLKFESPLKKSGLNAAIIPYVSARNTKDFEKKNPADGFLGGIGADAKIGVTSGLNLDLTANPDFSNVAVDKQVVNLTRFDISLPEQRQFFLENSDLFTGFGSTITNPFIPSTGQLAVGNQLFSPFFSRSVGISLDSTTGVTNQSRIKYGVRLSGKIDNNWRIGLMNVETGSDTTKKIDAQNYSVFALQRKVFDRSNIALIFVNKFNKPNAENIDSKFNRVGGLEYNLNSKSNEWQGKAYYHRSIDSDAKDKAFAHGAVLNYSVSRFIAKWSHDVVGAGFRSESGFVPRNDFTHFNPTLGINVMPKHSKYLNRYSFGVAYDQYNSAGIGSTDRKAGPFVLLTFKNTTRLLASINSNFTYLFKNFDALRNNDKTKFLQSKTSYRYLNAEANLVTNLREKLTFIFNPLVGQYYDGSIIAMSGNLNYRIQPYGLIALNYSYNNIKLSTGNNKVIIVGPNLDLTLTKSVFWTTYVQYNSQFKNMNLNSRLQWRFAPVSDFFLVYTDNYNTETWMPKNRAVFAKLNYWFSI